MTDTDPSRRTLIATIGAATAASGLITGIAAGDDTQTPATKTKRTTETNTNTAIVPCKQLGPDADPPADVVRATQDALAYCERKMNAYTNRPTNSYITDDGNPQIAYDTSETSESALRAQIRVAAMAWARVVNKNGGISDIQFRAYRAVLGEPYEYVASYHMTRPYAMEFTGGAYQNGSMGCDEYLSWAYGQLKWR